MSPYTPTNWADETPQTTPVRYRVKDSNGNILHDNVTIEVVTSILAGTPVNAANLNKIEQGLKTAQDSIDAGAPAVFQAKGDILVASGAGAGSRLPLGSSGKVLVADSSQALGMKWGDGGGFVFLEEQQLSAIAASVTFSNIPQTYRHLKLIAMAREGGGANTMRFRFNGDAGNNYSYRRFDVVGPATSEVIRTDGGWVGIITSSGAAASMIGISEMFIPYYANTSWFKNLLANIGFPYTSINPTIAMHQAMNLWENTGAITSLTLYVPSGQFAAGSRFSLYGMM